MNKDLLKLIENSHLKNQKLHQWDHLDEGHLVSIFEELKSYSLGDLKSSLWLIDGEVGSGKTTFIRNWLETFDISDVQSPTYSFHNRYQTKQGLIFDHFDLYRIQSDDELESIGFWDLVFNDGHVKIVEWSQNTNDLSWIKQNRFQKVFVLQIQNLENNPEFRIYHLYKLFSH